MEMLKWKRGDDPSPLPTLIFPGVSARKARWFVLDHLEEIQDAKDMLRSAVRLVIFAAENGRLVAEVQSPGNKKTHPVFLEEDFY